MPRTPRASPSGALHTARCGSAPSPAAQRGGGGFLRPRSDARAGEDGERVFPPTSAARLFTVGPRSNQQRTASPPAPFLTDFKAERKRPSGPERRGAGAAGGGSGGSESSPSGTSARGEGRADAPPGTDQPAPLGGTAAEGPGKGAELPRGRRLVPSALLTQRHLRQGRSPFPAGGDSRFPPP
ncbi:translation initiation factor IF-2-like [Apus apus]|uniref:translation initiation factor IF-2-like n=1 Tax=Apus apus TaxID=8895 RepID=UPI0021F8C1E1|nr:translation initiation factor IF-2-like [Apus apus]XP_051479638.1 translation initiation factor IF-2-like [Apus apus]